MATAIVDGQTTWTLSIDDEGHREYRIKHRVRGLKTDGPAAVRATAGLPATGDPWSFDDDIDATARCTRVKTITPLTENAPNTQWIVESVFSTRTNTQCYNGTGSSVDDVGNPLLEPDRISGTFIKFLEEARYDRHLDPILTSSFEAIRGPAVEFDNNRPSVRIEQNVAVLDLATLASMVDTVNDAELWGLPARCVKLSNIAWEKKYYGDCVEYFTRVLEFEVNYDTFDRDVVDEGTKVLRGAWDRDILSGTFGTYVAAAGTSADNPADFIRFQDWYGNLSRVILNGAGMPAAAVVGPGDPAGSIHIEKYDESNFLLLGVPAELE